MMLNLSNPLTILKAWLLLETCHGKWASLQLSQWGGLFSDMSATLTRPLRCMKLCGRITIFFIWWISVCLGATKVYVEYVLGLVWKWEMSVLFSMTNVPKGNEGLWGIWNHGKVGCQVRLRHNNNHLTVGNWGFRDFANDMGEEKMIGNGRI